MRVVLAAAVLILGGAACAGARATPDSDASSAIEIRAVAERYLNALAGRGDDSGRDLLLGGATTNARIFSLENWQIVGEQPARHEEADVALAAKLVAELDEASRVAMAGLMTPSGGAEAVSVEQITPEVAAQLMGPTQARADQLVAAVPVMAYVLRVGKSVYWNPANPARALLANAAAGPYVLDLFWFEVETKEGPRQVARRWPLRVLRFKTAQLDTGWKILPESDWNAE